MSKKSDIDLKLEKFKEIVRRTRHTGCFAVYVATHNGGIRDIRIKEVKDVPGLN